VFTGTRLPLFCKRDVKECQAKTNEESPVENKLGEEGRFRCAFIALWVGDVYVLKMTAGYGEKEAVRLNFIKWKKRKRPIGVPATRRKRNSYQPLYEADRVVTRDRHPSQGERLDRKGKKKKRPRDSLVSARRKRENYRHQREGKRKKSAT